MKRPANCTDKVLAELDKLNERGSPAIHSYGFGILQKNYGMTMAESYECVRYWQSLRAERAKQREAR